MIFSPKLYSGKVAKLILEGKKTQTRRLVKDGEYSNRETSPKIRGYHAVIHSVYTTKGKLKWIVGLSGKSYAVQLGRGKPSLWFCPKCRSIYDPMESPIWPEQGCNNVLDVPRGDSMCGVRLEPLRIELTEIRKEKLLDISEEDAEKEGFKSKKDYLEMFYNAFYDKPAWVIGEWNPDVWVLNFELVKEA